MKKKGISPLIATVLIIGFTIVLAALVMQWGSGLFEKIKTETGVSSEINIICSSKLTNLGITSAKYDDTAKTIAATIDNSNEQEITGFLFRIHVGDSVTTSEQKADADKLGAFAVKTYTISTTGLTITTTEDKLGVMPIVTATDGSTHTCTNEKLVIITAA